MAEATVSYNNGTTANNTISVPATLTVTETDLYVVTNYAYLRKSQVTVFADVTLGAVASATFYYYYSIDNGTTWYPVSLYNTSTGQISQRAIVVDSGTYATGGASRFVDNVPLGTSLAFKVTGKSASGTPTLNKVLVMVRDN